MTNVASPAATLGPVLAKKPYQSEPAIPPPLSLGAVTAFPEGAGSGGESCEVLSASQRETKAPVTSFTAPPAAPMICAVPEPPCCPATAPWAFTPGCGGGRAPITGFGTGGPATPARPPLLRNR